jgi:hypothetical protein
MATIRLPEPMHFIEQRRHPLHFVDGNPPVARLSHHFGAKERRVTPQDPLTPRPFFEAVVSLATDAEKPLGTP